MFAIIASIPILLTVIFMVVFNWTAKRSLTLSWLAAAIVAGTFWKMGLLEIIARTLSGFLGAFETISIIFGAIILMNVLKQSGAMYSINKMFSGITEDARIQAVLVGFIFAGFIEGSAGFGTPAALAAPILISLGFPPLAAAAVCLIYNSTPVNPGPVGVPLITAASVVSDAVTNLGGDNSKFSHLLTIWTCIPHMIGGVFIIMTGVFVLTKVFGKNHSFKDAVPAIPFCLLTAVVLGALYIPLSIFGTTELVSMLSFIIALPILIFCAKKGILMPKKIWNFDGYAEWGDKTMSSSAVVSSVKEKEMNPLLAWLPYIVIGVLLVMTRLNVAGLKTLFTNDPCIIHIRSILGFENINWDFKILYNPGFFPFLPIALLTIPMHKMTKEEAKLAITDSFRQIIGAAIALFFGVAMVNLYRYTSNTDIGMSMDSARAAAEYTFKNSSMLYAMARALADLFSSAYFLIAPLIGVLGAFMSGSCTVSNTLFASLQFETATLVGLSQVFIVALQSMGGAIGNMICVNNIVSVCATTGTNGNEGKLIRTNIIPCLMYACIVAIVVGILLKAGVNPMPELLK